MDVILEWVDACALLRQQRQAGQAAEKWAQVLARNKLDPTTLLEGLQQISYDQLRRARIRIDVMQMLVMRHFLTTLVSGGAFIYVYCDASPQFRGHELFSSSIEIIWGRGDSQSCLRRLLPQVSIRRDMLSSEMKLFALLWQIWLIAGPSPTTMRWFLSKIITFTTDFGAERLLVDKKDRLITFFRTIGSTAKVTPLSHTFPMATLIGGWRHIWDTILRRCCCSWMWFPVFLRRLKSCSRFFRNNKESVCENLTQQGYGGLADLVKSTSYPNFAEWRWGTLYSSADKIEGMYESIRAKLDLSAYKKQRDTKEIQDVKQAMASDLWYAQLRLVLFLSRWVTTAQSWIGGCPCHDEDLIAGREIKCWMKGRRLKQAWIYVEAHCEEALSRMNQWSVASFEDDVNFLAEATGGVRMVVRLAKEKMAWLNKLPYIICRLGVPGVRDVALAQFDSAPLERHHRLTVMVMSLDSQLGQDVRAMNADGTGMSTELAEIVRGLSYAAMDDSKGESPHAVAHREHLHSRSAAWPYVAATMRLKDNLIDVQGLTETLGLDRQHLWNQWKGVLQTKQRRRPARCKNSVFLQRVYFPRFQEMGDHGLDYDDGEVPAPPDGADGGKLRRPPDLGSEKKLVREFLLHTLKQYSYISYPQPEEDRFGLAFFQVLDTDRRNINIETFDFSESNKGMLLDRQRFEIMGRDDAMEGTGERYHVMAVSDPDKVDVLEDDKLVDLPNRLLQWQMCQDFPREGCITLENPCALKSDLPLSDGKVPTLCLLWSLRDKGWAPRKGLVVHNHDARAQIFDGRNLASRRAYFQCVHVLDKIHAAGVLSVRSDGPNAYYELLLRQPHKAIAARPATEYLKLLKDGGYDVEVPEIEEAEPAQIRHRDLGMDALAVAIAPDLGDEAVPARGARDRSPSSSSSGSGDSNSSSSSSSPSGAPAAVPLAPDGIAPDEPAPHVEMDAPIVPDFLFGKRVALESHGFHTGIRVRCCAGHPHCRIFASLSKWRRELGPQASVHILSCWLARAGGMDAADHRIWRPTLANVQEHIAAQD